MIRLCIKKPKPCYAIQWQGDVSVIEELKPFNDSKLLGVLVDEDNPSRYWLGFGKTRYDAYIAGKSYRLGIGDWIVKTGENNLIVVSDEDFQKDYYDITGYNTQFSGVSMGYKNLDQVQ